MRHVRCACGYAAVTLVVFRIYWALFGSDVARFSHFLRRTRAVWSHAKTSFKRFSGSTAGHNPLVGWSIMVMLLASFECQAAALIALSPHTSVEAIKSVDITQIWNSTPPRVAEGKNATVDVRLFDSESRPRQNGLYGCGWLLIGTGDVGVQPVGIRIWSNAKCDLLVSPATNTSGADERFTLTVNSSEAFEIRVDADSRVSIAGHILGVIKQ